MKILIKIRRQLNRNILIALIVVCVSSPAMACLWDYDTLRDEKRGMPGIAEVLAGQWERHSQFFYDDRVKKMKVLLASKPDDLDAMDNLAVAYFKLGQTDQAIEVMLDKQKRFGEQYTTYSNLGTFYMLSGRLDEAIGCLKKALAINPIAHFGREEYQLALAEYLQRVKTHPELRDHSFVYLVFDPTVATSRPTTEPDVEAEILGHDFDSTRGRGNPYRLASMGFKENIIEGVVGMLRFGTDQSPDLYYALGDLLAFRGDKNLAVRAYQRALDLNYPRPDAIKNAIDQTEEMQVPRGGLNQAVISAERADAAKWVADYQQFEDDLVRAGKNTDDEASYLPFFATHSRSLATSDLFLSDYTNEHFAQIHPGLAIWVICLTATMVVLGGRILLRRFHRVVVNGLNRSA